MIFTNTTANTDAFTRNATSILLIACCYALLSFPLLLKCSHRVGNLIARLFDLPKAIALTQIANYYYENIFWLFRPNFPNGVFAQIELKKIKTYIELRKNELPLEDPRTEIIMSCSSKGLRINCLNNDAKMHFIEVIFELKQLCGPIMLVSENGLPVFNFKSIIPGVRLNTNNILQRINKCNEGRIDTSKWRINNFQNLALNQTLVEFSLNVEDYRIIDGLGHNFQFQGHCIEMNLVEMPRVRSVIINECYFEIPEQLFILHKLIKGTVIFCLGLCVHFNKLIPTSWNMLEFFDNIL